MNRQRIKRIRGLCSSLVLVLVLVACGGADGEDTSDDADEAPPAEEEEEEESGTTDGDAEEEAASRGPFKVALFLPEVGPFAGIADDQADGFKHYIEDLNGGILAGYDIEIIEADTANDPAIAQETLERLVERDEVDAVVGVISSAVAYAIAPYLTSTGLPTIFTAAAADDLTQRQGAENIFRVTTASSQIMHPLGTHACEVLGYETAAMLSLDYSFGWEAMAGFARAYQDAGCEVIQELYAPLGTADWGPQVQQINRDADVVVQLTTGPDAVSFLQAYQDFGIELPMLASGFATDPSTLTDARQRQLGEGILSVMWYAEGAETPENQAFQESFRDRYGYTPGAYTENTYTAAMVLEAALSQVDQLSYETLSAAIGDVVLTDAPRGRVSFDEDGQAYLPAYIRELVPVGDDFENRFVDLIAEEVSQFWNIPREDFLAETPYADRRGTWAN